MEKTSDRVERVVLFNESQEFKTPYSSDLGYTFKKKYQYQYQSRWKDHSTNSNSYRWHAHNHNRSYHPYRYRSYNSYNSYKQNRGGNWKNYAPAADLNRPHHASNNHAIQENIVSTSKSTSSDNHEGKVERKTILNLNDADDEDDTDDASTTISDNEIQDILLFGINRTSSSSLEYETDNESIYKTEEDEPYEPQPDESDTSSIASCSSSTFQGSDVPKKPNNYNGLMDIDLDETTSQISVASESILTSLYKSKNIDHQLYDEMKVLVQDQVRREVEKISLSKSNKTTFASLEHVDIRQKVRRLMDECFRQKMVVMLSKDPEEHIGNISNSGLRLKLHELMNMEKDLGITPPDIGIKYELKCLMIDNFKETTRIIFLELKEDELAEVEPSSVYITHPSLKQEYIELRIIESRIKKIFKRRIEFIQKQIEKGTHVIRHKLMEEIDSFMFTTIISNLSSMMNRIHRLAKRNMKNNLTPSLTC